MSSNTARITALAIALGLIISSAGLRAQTRGGPQAQSGEAEVEGVLEVQVEDAVGGSSVHRFLDTNTGRLRLKEKPGKAELAGLETGSRIKVRGKKNGNNNELELTGGSSSSVTTMALANSNTFGQQRVVVLLVNFQDNTSAPYGWSEAYQTTFGSVSDYYRENSYGQTWLTGDVFGWYTLPTSSSTCDYSQIASLADQAATNAGVNLGNYTRKVYAFPRNACGWWGLGTVGGYPSQAWINGTYALKVVAHELGHNFGDWHSKSEPCDPSGCSLIEYGDDRDIMGQAGIGHLNAFQKERLGWLNYGSSPAIQTVTAPGTYWVDSLQTSAVPAKALKILKSSNTSGRTYYYVESRSQLGFDAGYSGGVVIHTGNDTDGNTSQEVDLDRGTSAFDAVLEPGQSFTDPAIGLTITTVSSDSTGASINIQLPPPPCTTRALSMSVAPSGTISALRNVPATLSATVRSNDDGWCGTATFNVAATLPSGWGWSADQPALSLAPGATTTVALTVTPSSTASGPATATFTSARTSGSGPGGSVTANFQVSAPAPSPSPTPSPTPSPSPTPTPTPPPTTGVLKIDLRATGGSNYAVTTTVFNGSGLVNGAVVKFVVRDPRGSSRKYSATTNSSGVAMVSGTLRGKDPRGTYQVTATVTYGGQTATATGTFVY